MNNTIFNDVLKCLSGLGEMAKWVRGLAAKMDSLSSIP